MRLFLFLIVTLWPSPLLASPAGAPPATWGIGLDSTAQLPSALRLDDRPAVWARPASAVGASGFDPPDRRRARTPTDRPARPTAATAASGISAARPRADPSAS